MKTACFVPIKANSERVPGKNLRELNGKNMIPVLQQLKIIVFIGMLICQ